MKRVMEALLEALKTSDLKMGRSTLKIARLIREVNAAKEDVEIESWSDFESWWTNNRSQSLVFTFVDIYGEDSPEVQQVRELVEMSETLETKLHGFYMELRKKELGVARQDVGPETPSPEQTQNVEESPESDESDEEDDLNEIGDFGL